MYYICDNCEKCKHKMECAEFGYGCLDGEFYDKQKSVQAEEETEDGND